LPLILRLRLQKIWADSAYKGDLVGWCFEQLHILLEIVSRPADQKGFILLPRHWVVERSFAWLGNYRRLSKDYEETIPSSTGMIYLASVHRMLRLVAV
jgi:putative transposase